MASSEELRQYRIIEKVQHEAGERLYALPGVTGSAVGYKVAAGQETRQVCLVVFVNRKRRLPAGDPSLVLLEELGRHGVAIDVVERRNVNVPVPLVRADTQPLNESRTDVMDPMIGGVSCGPDVNIIRAPHAGTLGIAVARTVVGGLGILSNAHVLFHDRDTSTVCQPARSDSFRNHPAGDRLAAFQGDQLLDGRPTWVDCAVASVLPDRSAMRKRIFGIEAAVTGILRQGQVGLGDPVTKSGLQTDVTTGTVKYLSMSAGNGVEPNQFAIAGDDDEAFAKAGDSGSVVLIGTDVMGLLWGENSDEGVEYSIVSPIEAVLQNLSVEI